MSWIKYAGALLVVIVILGVVEEIAPKAALPLVLLILLSVAILRPNFFPEFVGIFSGKRG